MSTGRVTFISVTPETSDLLPLRAARAIAESDFVLWVGHTVCHDVLRHASRHADIMIDDLGSTHTLSPFYDLASREGFRIAHIRPDDPAPWDEILEHVYHCGELGLATELVRS